MDKLLLTATEAADVLGIGRTKVYELLRVGAIESVRVGKRGESQQRRCTSAWSGFAPRRRVTRSPERGQAASGRRGLRHVGRVGPTVDRPSPA
jgi:excisionase family DNA binding protein